MLGICDKIVPGLVIGAADLRPPAGDLRARRADDHRPAQRREVAHPPALRRGQGRPRRSCWRPRCASYHGPGTCTFYGTANSNQMLMEIMGLHLPGASFVNPNTPLRDALTVARRQAGHRDHRARQRVHADRRGDRRAGHRQRRRRPARHRRLDQPHAAPGRHGARRRHPARPGTTSPTCPRSCRCWPGSIPNGLADVNHFHAAGGMGFLIRELLDAGLLHADVRTVAGRGRAGALPRRAVPRRRHAGLAARAAERSLDDKRPARRSRSRSAPTAGSSCSTAISAGR